MKKSLNKKIILGLTGSFGTGKSTVSLIFESLGAKIIDADKLSRNCLKKNTVTYRKITAVFGKGIVLNNGVIDRRKLARAAFKNINSTKKLNDIIHPVVIKNILKQLDSTKKGVIVMDVPLLFETGLEKLADKVVVVKLARAKQLMRIKKKSLLSDKEINKRIKTQLPLSFKVRKADFVIDNNGSIEKTKKQTQAIWRKLVSSAA